MLMSSQRHGPDVVRVLQHVLCPVTVTHFGTSTLDLTTRSASTEPCSGWVTAGLQCMQLPLNQPECSSGQNLRSLVHSLWLCTYQI
jgi:hypothetical protein